MTLKQLLLKNKKDAFLYAIGVLLAGFSGILLTLAIANVFRLFDSKSIQETAIIILSSIALGTAPVLIQVASRFLRIGFMTNTLKEVRVLAYESTLAQSNESYNSKSKQDYQSLLISDINLFEKDFFLSVLNIGYSAVNTILNLLLLLWVAWQIALTSFLTIIVLTIITKAFENKIRDTKRQVVESNAVYNDSLNNLVHGAPTIKHYAKENRFLNLFRSDTQSLETRKGQSYEFQERFNNITSTVAFFSSMLIILYATYLLGIGQISMPQMVIVMNVGGSISWSLISAFRFVNTLKSSIDVYNRIVSDHLVSQGSVILDDKLAFTVENLSFAYNEAIPIFENLNFKIEPFEKVLIHGPSGTGKTTLLNNLSQNLSKYQGSIQLGSQELNQIEHNKFLDHASYIRQSHFMFDDTIKNNIILNKPYDPLKYDLVLKQSALSDWLSDGEDIILESNGANISGGQRQRISFARELYSDSDIIFIDEPSASLDDDNAEIIYQTIINLNKTVICVSHRHLTYLSKHFDHIISFDQEGAVKYEKV